MIVRRPPSPGGLFLSKNALASIINGQKTVYFILSEKKTSKQKIKTHEEHLAEY
jgi:Holliday junction resolvase